MLVTTIVVYGFTYLIKRKKKRLMIPSCINENILSNVNVFDYQKQILPFRHAAVMHTLL